MKRLKKLWRRKTRFWQRKISKRLQKLARKIRQNRVALQRLIWPKTLKSHPLSKALRPVFESRRVKRILGVILILFVFSAGQMGFEVAAFKDSWDKKNLELTALPAADLPVKTMVGLQKPLENFLITQRFWFFHRAVDLAAPSGTEIRPLMQGKILSVNQGGWPWGKAVWVDHGSDLVSFYAHLSEIDVVEDEEVTMTTVIGKVGSTGHSTGDHLHLEVYQNGEALDPLTLLNQN